jgi:hypothetical protein
MKISNPLMGYAFICLIDRKKAMNWLTKMWKKRFVGLAIVTIALFSSCAEVREYQKAYLNDEDMKLAQSKLESMESGFQSYREGASGAESGKIGGGCGCN